LPGAILAEPDIFIMDEATSSVDTLTDGSHSTGMENLMRGEQVLSLPIVYLPSKERAGSLL
jgi:ABC-type multidrug transport system fused ATPase/permease subunit